jgi:transposase
MDGVAGLGLAGFNLAFPDDEACFRLIVQELYDDGIPCRTCGRVRTHHKLKNRPALSCDVCRTQIHPLAATIFARSPTPLKTWFYGLYLMGSTDYRLSARQLQEELGVTYKTAWRIYRSAMNVKTGSEEVKAIYDHG